jgi:hypothetical protein
MDGKQFYYCSGAFKMESVIHEFLHHVVHRFVKEAKDAVCNILYFILTLTSLITFLTMRLDRLMRLRNIW